MILGRLLYSRREYIILKKSNIHHGDINKDSRFDCENNCPYCNNEVICIKPQYVFPNYEFIEWADIYKKFRCKLCGKEFWEVWYASVDKYYYPDDEADYFDEIGDYTDSYYNDRYDDYCGSFEKAVKTGDLCLVDASYQYTIIKFPFYEKEIVANLPYKYNYPIYRRMTP